MAINKTVVKLRSELKEANKIIASNERQLAKDTQRLQNVSDRNIVLEQANNSQAKQIKAYEEKITEVCNHNDACRKEAMDAVKMNEELLKDNEDLITKLRRSNEDVKRLEESYRRAASEFGIRMFESGELRKPSKLVALNLKAIANESGVQDINSMTIAETRKLAADLDSVLKTAQ